MSYPQPSSLLTAINILFSPQFIDGQLNPVHLTIATQGYWIQSSILRIPNQYGFFSPGPPRLQVHQGALFGVLSFHFGILCILGASIVFWVGARGDPVLPLASAMVALVVGAAASIWVAACYDCRRSPDYDWGDSNGKLRKN